MRTPLALTPFLVLAVTLGEVSAPAASPAPATAPGRALDPAPVTWPRRARDAGPSPTTAADTTARPDTLRIPGLNRPVRIVKDRWGISHIYAETEEDLFFAQGWNAARDRLFQLELWRRSATGTTAEFLGPRALERDVGARLFRYRGDMDAELGHYHPRGRAIVEAFVRGVNAWVERTREEPSLLPVEFRLLGLEPGLWSPEVVVSRHNGLLGNARWELDYGRAVARVGAEAVKAVSGFGPGDPELALDPAVDGDLLFRDVLAPYVAFTTPIEFRPEDVVEAHRATDDGARAAGEPGWARPHPADDAGRAPGPDAGTRRAQGSNNWVVAGRLSESRRPLMANDPHRALGVPSVRYWVHLSGPGWNVVGAGEPTIPGVSIGHNEHGAWGLTVFETDGEDLYVYETDPDDPERYRYGRGWERMEVEADTIAVEGRDPAVVELRYTRHGPVVYRDTARDRAFAVRAAWLEPGGAPYLASLRMDQARTWEEFRRACAWFHIPGENMVWAGRDGTIGWQAVGIAPIRREWSGLVPVPGDGRYEWDGFLPIPEKPHASDPPAGFLVTANNDLIPPDYEHPDAIAYEWAVPYRWARVGELLASGRRHSLADMAAYQMDWLSVPARQLVPLLEPVRAEDPRVAAAREMLLGWDRVMDPASPAAAVYALWEERLREALEALLVPEPAREWLSPPLREVVGWLVTPHPALASPSGDPVAGRDSLLSRALRGAVSELVDRLGPDPAGWRYGGPRMKHALLRHPLSEAVDEGLRERLDVGPVPRGGYGYTVNMTGSGLAQRSGASFRILVDTEDWDRTLGTLATGQSGDPDNPHYEDLFRLWSENRYFPVYFSREKVEAAARERLDLVPSRSP